MQRSISALTQLGFHHHAHYIGHLRARPPAKTLPGERWIRAGKSDVSRPEQPLIDINVLRPAEPDFSKCPGDELLERVGFSGGNHVRGWSVLLQHHPHCLDVLRCPSPVTLNAQVAQAQPLTASAGN